MNFDAIADRETARAETIRRQEETADHGANTIDEMIGRAAVAAERTPAYRPSKPAEIEAGKKGEERRAMPITLGRLWIDCGRAIARWAPQYRQEHARSLQTDVMALILRWPNQGGGINVKTGKRTAVIDLGARIPLGWARTRARMTEKSHRAVGDPRARGIAVTRWIDAAEKVIEDGTLPLRRDWIPCETEPAKLSLLAWRALRAAVKQASETRDFLTAVGTDKTEEPHGDSADFDALVEEERANHEPDHLPAIDDPEIIARLLHLPLDCGRAVIARSRPDLSRDDLARGWADPVYGPISAENISRSIGRGEKRIRCDYPDPAELLTAIDRAADQWAMMREAAAYLAVRGYAAAELPESEAAAAVGEWRDARRYDYRRAAMISATRGAIIREGGSPDATDLPERIISSVHRIIAAETRRAYIAPNIGGPRPFARGWIERYAAEPANGHTRRLNRAERVWTYGLTARDDRAARVA